MVRGRTLGRAVRRTRRRAAVAVARSRGRLSDSLAARPRRRFGTALALAFGINAILALLLSFVPSAPLPDAPIGTPVEIVFLDPEPQAGPAATRPDEATTDPAASAPRVAPPPDAAPEAAPAPPAAARGPAVDLPPTEATGTPGVVAIDCNRIFEDEARATACAGGQVISGWQAEVENLEADWSRLAERIGRARRSLQPVPTLTDPDAAERYGAEAAARAAANERRATYDPVLIGVSPDVAPDTGDTSGAGAVAPPSLITSYGDRKAADEERRIREDGRILREMGRDD